MTHLVLRLRKVCFLFVASLLIPQTISAGPIYIGDVYTQPADAIKRLWPFVSYLAKQLQSEGIDQGKVIVVKTIPEMANLLREGKVDLFIDSPFPAVAVSRLSGSKFLLRRWKKKMADYRGVIFVRKDSGIDRLQDLKGKIIAFEEPFSTSTYFLPKLAMVQKGLYLAPKREAFDPVGSNEVGYVFVGDDPNIMFAVLKGKVSAGALNNKNYLKEARGNLDNLKIIHETFSIPRQIVSYRVDLNPTLVNRIKEILLKMDQSEEGKKTLADFENTTKFDEIPANSMAPILKAGKFIDAEFNIK